MLVVPPLCHAGAFGVTWKLLRQEPDSGERDYMYVVQLKQVPSEHAARTLVKMQSRTFMVVSADLAAAHNYFGSDVYEHR